MKRLTWLVLPALFVAAMACSSGSNETATGKAVFTVSDAAADMEAVSEINLTVDGFEIRSESGAWTTVSTETQTYSLLELNASGAAALLADAELESGTYDQLRLDISSVTVIDDQGQEHDAKVPSGELKLMGEVDVEAGATSSADFDFIAHESLHSTVNGEFVFAPVVEFESKSNVEAEIDSNSEVTVNGGQTTAQSKVGMDISGNVGAGLRVTQDAVLDVSSSGALVQIGGNGVLKGTVKSVNEADGTITLATKSGNEVQLQVAADTALSVSGSSSTLADLSGRIGSSVVVEYNAKHGTLLELNTQEDAESQAETGVNLNVSGVIKSVDESDSTVTVETDDGAEVTLSIDGNLLGNITGSVGARVDAEYDASTNTATEVETEAEAEMKTEVATIVEVDASSGQLTIETSSGQELTLNVNSDSEMSIDGSLATMANIKSQVGSEIEVTYNAANNVIAQADVEAQADAGAEASASGTIEAVNPVAGTVTVALDNGETLVLDVTSRTQVIVGGSVSSLVSLAAHVGESVEVRYDAETDAALNIQAAAEAAVTANVEGTVESVNTAANTITITAESGQQIVLDVASETRILVDGAVSGIAEVAGQVGGQVDATYNAETNVASEISVDIQASAEATASGTIEAVNAAEGTITVVADGGQQIVLDLASDTQILVDGAAASAAELAANIGSQVTVTYDAAASVATEVNASASASTTASASGAVQAVNAANGTITVLADNGEELVLEVNSTTDATLNGASATMAELAANIGATVEVTYDVNSMVATVIDAQAEGEGSAESNANASGTLETANAFTGEVTLLLDSGTELVLEVTSETEILVDGSTATMADLATEIGSSVTATYEAETSTLLTLQVN